MIRVKASMPLQRGGQAEEVAQAILWLLSEEASYVTGARLDVAGGDGVVWCYTTIV